MRSSITIIANPAAKNASGGKIERAGLILRARGFETETLLTRNRGDAELLARGAVVKNPHCIIAAGGDGTINEVLNGAVGSEVSVAFLPLGTTNVLAKELGIPEDIEGAVEAAFSRRARRVSLGRIQTTDLPKGRYFCLMAGVGLDGKAVRDVSGYVKKISGKAAYILSGISNICTFSQEELLVRLDGAELKGYGAIVCKASKYGGHFRVAPEASLENAFFYTCVFKGRRRRDFVRYAVGVMTGRHLRYDDVAYVRSSEVEIEGRAHIQIDGDYLGLSPARLSVAKDIVNLIY
jgi:diacylglycerol kinase (ATP)